MQPQYDELFLCETGSDGLHQLKHRIDELDQIFIAFYREELGPGEEPIFALVNYIPSNISAVKRGMSYGYRVPRLRKKQNLTGGRYNDSPCSGTFSSYRGVIQGEHFVHCSQILIMPTSIVCTAPQYNVDC